jgi:leucyl/phenylalanyl-tRNA--protein transferase
VLTPELLLTAYSRGVFPMAHEDGAVYWHDPDPRALFPLEQIAPNPRALRAFRKAGFTYTHDQCFEDVMQACATERDSTWITEEMIAAYAGLHTAGLAHSVEVWQRGALVGGIYGVSIGGAFFGESMFSRVSNASKAAFHELAQHLKKLGFTVFDSQYINDHTRSLGAVEIPRHEFRKALRGAIDLKVHF